MEPGCKGRFSGFWCCKVHRLERDVCAQSLQKEGLDCQVHYCESGCMHNQTNGASRGGSLGASLKGLHLYDVQTEHGRKFFPFHGQSSTVFSFGEGRFFICFGILFPQMFCQASK